MATAKNREVQPIEKKRPWGPVKEDLYGRFPLLITFWMVCQFLQNFWKTPRMPVFYEFPQHFCGILFIYSLCWFVIYSLFCPGVGVLSHVPCPMWGFSKINVPALPLSIGTCGGMRMLGIALTAWSIKFPWLVFIVVVVVVFIFAPLALLVWDMLQGGEGRVGRGGVRVLGVNIVKCRNATT